LLAQRVRLIIFYKRGSDLEAYPWKLCLRWLEARQEFVKFKVILGKGMRDKMAIADGWDWIGRSAEVEVIGISAKGRSGHWIAS